MQVAIDVDCTLNDCHRVWAYFIRTRGWNSTFDWKDAPPGCFSYAKSVVGPAADALWRDPGFWDSVCLLPGAAELLAGLDDPILITANLMPAHDEWIYRHLGDQYQIVRTSLKYKYTGGRILVDDCPEQIYEHVRRNGCPGVLFNPGGELGYAAGGITTYKELKKALADAGVER